MNPSRFRPNSSSSSFDEPNRAWSWSSPPPPYSEHDQSTSEESSSLRSGLNDQNSEVTPLLENFTRKFAEQVTKTENGAPQSQHVPPELLRVYQQQSPFNPTFDVESSGESTSSSVSRSSSMLNATGYEATSSSQFTAAGVHPSFDHLYRRRKRKSKVGWFASNLAFFVSLAAFNVGSLVAPSFYSTFFNSLRADSSTSHVFNLIVIASLNFVAVGVVFVASLILLYAGSKLTSVLRRKQLNVFRSGEESSWFAVTYERIVEHTLGTFFAKLFSVVFCLYSFGLSTLGVVLMSDLLDIVLSTLTIDHLSETFCREHPWYLNHNVVLSIWLLSLSSVVFLGCSCFGNNRHHRLLTLLKRLTALLGLLSTASLCGLLGYTFYSDRFAQGDSRETLLLSRLSSLTQIREHHKAPHSVMCFDNDAHWGCFERHWLLLLVAFPLLLLPFHFNDFLVTFLFLNQNEERSETAIANTNSAFNMQPANSVSIDSGMHSEENFYRLYLPYQQAEAFASGVMYPTLREAPSLVTSDDTPLRRPSPSPQTGTQRSLTSLRNLVVWVLAILLAVNLFTSVALYFMQTSPQPVDSAEAYANPTSEATLIPEQFFRRRFAKFDSPEEISDRESAHSQTHTKFANPSSNRIELNFLRSFLGRMRIPGTDKKVAQYAVAAVCGLLLLKSTFVYLLTIVRGMLSYEIAFAERTEVVSTCCLRSFLFVAPFALWNLLSLLLALALEHYLPVVRMTLLVTTWLGAGLVLVFPSLVLAALSLVSIRRRRTNSLFAATKLLSWPKSSLLSATILLLIGLFFVALWPYGYWRSGDEALSPIPLIVHNDTQSLFCAA